MFAPTGFLDDTWFHRSYWVYGKNFAGGHNGYYQAGKNTPSGRIVVFDDKEVFGYARQPQYYDQEAVLGQLEARILSGQLKVGDRLPSEEKLADLFGVSRPTVRAALQELSAAGTVVVQRGRGGGYRVGAFSLDNLQTVTARINRGEGALGRFLNDEAMARSLSNTTANLDQVTGRLSRGEGTAGKLLTDQQLYDRLNSMANRIDQVTAGLEAGRGTAGALLRDQQLYENMNGAVAELRGLLAEIKKDPRKYLRVSVSIF